MSSFPWCQHHNINPDPNLKVKQFTEILLNIMSNFVPRVTKRIVPRDPPWMLNRKNRHFESYKRHGYKPDNIRIDNFRKECQEAVETAELSYSTKIVRKLNDQSTGQKSCWKIINVINNCKSPKLPPRLVNNLFVLNCRENAKLFTDFFHGNVNLILTISFSPTSIIYLLK